MNFCVLRYAQYDRVKPIYHLAEGDKFVLTARIDREDKVLYNAGTAAVLNNKENGLYFVKVVMDKKPMWKYTYENFHKKGYNYFEIDYASELENQKGSGVIENKIFYKSMREEQLKDYFVLYE